MKSSFKPNGFWEWYVFFPPQSLSFLFILYNTYFCYLYIIFFLFCCFFSFLKVVQSTFRMEEMYHSVSQQLDDERKRRVAAVQILTIAENSNADLKQKTAYEISGCDWSSDVCSSDLFNLFLFFLSCITLILCYFYIYI